MVDLRPGRMVVETPPQALGMFDDRWWQWIVDFGQCAERAAGVGGGYEQRQVWDLTSNHRRHILCVKFEMVVLLRDRLADF
jgi:hypothetical protein